MKISRLIQLLELIKEDYGDILVCVYDETEEETEVKIVNFKPGWSRDFLASRGYAIPEDDICLLDHVTIT